MRSLLSGAVLGLCLLCSCSAPDSRGPRTTGATFPNGGARVFNEVCIFTGRPVDDGTPSAGHEGARIGFCCTMCVAEWDGMDDAAREAAFAEACEGCEG